MKPISLEIVTQVITTFDHCSHCELIFDEAGLRSKHRQKEIDEYPQDLKEDFLKLSDLIRDLARLYKHRLHVRIIDAKSLMGVYKSLRFRIKTYPTFIVEGKEALAGWDRSRLEGILDKYVKAYRSIDERRLISVTRS